MAKQYKARDRTALKMSRDGLVEENLNSHESRRVSKRTADERYDGNREESATFLDTHSSSRHKRKQAGYVSWNHAIKPDTVEGEAAANIYAEKMDDSGYRYTPVDIRTSDDDSGNSRTLGGGMGASESIYPSDRIIAKEKDYLYSQNSGIATNKSDYENLVGGHVEDSSNNLRSDRITHQQTAPLKTGIEASGNSTSKDSYPKVQRRKRQKKKAVAVFAVDNAAEDSELHKMGAPETSYETTMTADAIDDTDSGNLSEVIETNASPVMQETHSQSTKQDRRHGRTHEVRTSYGLAKDHASDRKKPELNHKTRQFKNLNREARQSEKLNREPRQSEKLVHENEGQRISAAEALHGRRLLAEGYYIAGNAPVASDDTQTDDTVQTMNGYAGNLFDVGVRRSIQKRKAFNSSVRTGKAGSHSGDKRFRPGEDAFDIGRGKPVYNGRMTQPSGGDSARSRKDVAAARGTVKDVRAVPAAKGSIAKEGNAPGRRYRLLEKPDGEDTAKRLYGSGAAGANESSLIRGGNRRESPFVVSGRLMEKSKYQKLPGRLTEKRGYLVMSGPERKGDRNRRIQKSIYRRNLQRNYRDAYLNAGIGTRIRGAFGIPQRNGPVSTRFGDGSKGGVLSRFVSKKIKGKVTAAVLAFAILFVTIFGFAGVLFESGMTAIAATTYQSTDEDIHDTEDAYKALEAALDAQINGMETTHPGYDEYRYQVDEISHNPYQLISFLTVLYGEFTLEDVRDVLKDIFEAQYTLNVWEEVETRTRMVTKTGIRPVTDPDTGEETEEEYEYEEEEEYEYRILNISLTNKGLDAVARENLTDDQFQLYEVYNATFGNRPNLFDAEQIPSGGAGVGSDGYSVPTEALSDERFASMYNEASKYLGYPYVWGGSSPSTSFDCSGFVSWVINNCGNGWNVGRQTAEGLRGCCSYVPPGEAKPGDLIFFQGTYNTSGASHVGIVVGDGKMIHCGKPVQIASYQTPYWQQHFFQFGRLP